MQCWSCTFENLPGAQLCARCGSRLSLVGVAVEPPRAGRHHAATAVRRTGYRLRSLCPDLTWLWDRLGVLIPESLDSRALAWSIVPGLGHLKTGRRKWGRVLLPAWLGFFVLMVLAIGTNWARFMLAGMVVVHALAVVTLFAANLAFERLLMRAAFGLVVFLGISFFLYEPCVWFCSRFLVAVPIARSPGGTVVQDGDGLLCEGSWIRPAAFARGDIVLYRLDALAVGGVLIQAGHGVNRVIAVPGDRVTRKDGMLSVNGEPLDEAHAPLGHLPFIRDLDITLGPREYAVFTALELLGPLPPRANALFTGTVTQHLTVVSYDDILGRVLLRLRPLARFGRLG